MKKVNLFEEDIILECANCNKNLFEDSKMSIAVFIKDSKSVIDVYTCCKGKCDERLKMTRGKDNYTDGWKELDEFMNPLLYLNNIMAVINSMNSGIKFSEKAIEEYRNILLATAPYVMREITKEEERSASAILSFPF